MKKLITTLSLATMIATLAMADHHQASPIELVSLPSPESPLVAVRLMFKIGSIHDPAGKEGLAALTGMMIGSAGTRKHSYNELTDLLYPMAASIDVNTDREVTLISGEIHRDNLSNFTNLMLEAVLQPGFSESDFSRNKELLHSYLTSTLRATNDELLGLEAIQQVVFAGRPYEHSPAGTVQALAAISLDDVKAFYLDHYTQPSLMLGIAGGYPEDYPEQLKESLAALPRGSESPTSPLPQPSKVEGRRFTLIEKETDSVGIHFGHSLPINRADDDYYPLMVANSFLGEHRTFHGRLMQQLRGKRGLNYGDYSYIEYWNNPPFTTSPAPNVPRRQQYFSVWLRPVRPSTAHFALRNALYETERLIANGLTEEEFELTRKFVLNYSKLWAQSLADRLGFLMDSRFYGIAFYVDEIDRRLEKITVADVNRAIKKYLGADNLHVVMVTDNANEVKNLLQKGAPSPLEYNTAPEEDVARDDETIEKLVVNPAHVRIVPVADMFQK